MEKAPWIRSFRAFVLRRVGPAGPRERCRRGATLTSPTQAGGSSMATLTEPRAPSQTPGVLFHDATWVDYETMLRLVGERPIRVTYDRGTMEVFMPSFGHEYEARLIGRIIDTLTDELDIPVMAGRTTTHRRQDLDRGAEPDQCYWLRENARRIARKLQLDLATDPPPDLVVEVDVTSSSLERLPIFATLGISEVWRVARGRLEFLHRQADGTYAARDRSLNFPTVPVTEIARFLDLGRNSEATTWIRSFRAFVRLHLIPPRPPERPEGAGQP